MPSSTPSFKESLSSGDLEKVVDRLIQENGQLSNTIDKVKLALSSTSEFEGTTVVGGVKALLKAYLDEKETNFNLNKELRKMVITSTKS